MRRRILRADPAGNITLFVLDPVPRAERPALAARLMALPGLQAEQVGFLCPPQGGGQGRLEMAGGEFCGNAARAFGILLARRQGRSCRVLVEVSGCTPLVAVDADLSAQTAQAWMPPPLGERPVTVGGQPATLVELAGIAHLVVQDIPPSLDFFAQAEPLFRTIPNLEAYGVLFLEGDLLRPLVKVPAAGTLVWEGSCGSGSLAAAAAQSLDTPDGPFSRSYIQPAGTIQACVTRQAGAITSASIGGPVTLGLPFEVEL